MKKSLSLLLIAAMCLCLAACGKDEKEKTDTKESAEDIQIDTDEPEKEAKSYTLSTEDGGKSVDVQAPEGYEPLDYMSESMLNFEREEENGIEQVMMRLMDQSEAQVSETLRQEVQYAVSANATGEQVIEEVQRETEGGLLISYFGYSYDTEGSRIAGVRAWTVLENESVYVYTAENMGSNIEAPNADTVVSDMVSGIKK